MANLVIGDKVKLQFKIDIMYNGNYFKYIDMYAENETIDVLVGSTTLFSGINEKLVTMSPGETQEFILSPEKSFGIFDATKILDVDKSLISPSGDDIVIGQVYRDAVTNNIGYVKEINETTVKVDYNSKLAGQSASVNLTVIEKL